MVGDCDKDEDCDGDLFCGKNNCGEEDYTGGIFLAILVLDYLITRLLGLLRNETLRIKE